MSANPCIQDRPTLRPLGTKTRRKAMVALATLAVIASACAQVPEQILKSFGHPAQSGSRPAGVLVGADGALYGTTASGGGDNGGTVFRVKADGSDYRVLHAFGTNSNDGTTPQAGLVQGRDGRLYGTTATGGPNGAGIVFKLATDGSAYTQLCLFKSPPDDAASPTVLIQGSDGALYGVSQLGGTNYHGALFRLGTDGSEYQILHHFGNYDGLGNNPDGTTPTALYQGGDGNLYGVTQEGGTNANGTVFRVASNGSSFAVLHSFGDDGRTPVGIAQANNGVLFGVTQYGGINEGGIIFRLNPDGSGFRKVHEFTGTDGDGANPGTGMLRGGDDAWYGTTLNGGSDQSDGTVFRMNSDGSGYEVLRRFTVISSVLYDLFSTDGQHPGPLAQGANGVLYGATAYGGTTGQGAYQDTGAGTLFALATNGVEYAVVYNFSSTGGDGETPVGGLTLGQDGSFYGMTQSGGPAGQGSVFKINANGKDYQILHGFGLSPIDGHDLEGGLRQGADGMLYGTTQRGGYVGGSGNGIIFKVNPDGSRYTEVLSFGFWAAVGEEPTSPPIQGRDGNLYGTTSSGGYITAQGGLGMIYRVDTNGLGFTTLHQFNTNNLEGRVPYGGLIQGSDGVLYGTTVGDFQSGGTVYRIRPSGSGFQVLHTFTNSAVDGKSPYAGLILGTDGFLYGTAQYGGTNGAGTVFKLSTSGSDFQVVHYFGSVLNDGGYPTAPVTQGSDGYLYGTTPYGMAYTGPGLAIAANGVAFKCTTNGADYTVLHRFGNHAGDGRNPKGGLTEGLDGAFYGATSAGGNLNAGTVFRLGPAPLAFTSFSRLPDKTVSLSLSGASNTTCRIDTSANLVNWVTLTNIPDITGGVQFIDGSAAIFPRRFYRAVQGP